MPQIELTYKGLWKGVDTSLPETDIDPAASPFINNFILRKGEIRTRFACKNICLAPPDQTPVLGLTSFVDANNLVHTVAITQLGVYQLSYAFSGPNYKSSGRNPWLVVFNFPSTQTTIPYSIGNFQGSIFFTNGSPNVWKWNGISNVVTNVGILSTGTCGASYLMELAGRIVLASTIEVAAGVITINPFRVRWSAVNLASTTFDPATNIGAGFNDELDCPDTITGILPIGRTGYVFRSNGITEMLPTSGQGLAFDFNHLWASDRGIGNAYPQTLAGFGPLGIFGSGEAFYKITPNSFDDISKGATDEILTDIFNRTGSASSTILPYFSTKYPYTVYMLNIQIGNDTVQWIHDLKEGSWTRNTFKDKFFTCKPKYVFIS